jgi:ubiquinone/menaquinone biosynthesis C-methylase UbiE
MHDKVNLGCGPNPPAGWLNVDGSWNAWFAHHPLLRKMAQTAGIIKPNQGAQWKVRPLVHDLTRSLPFQANTITAIYASHVLEHLYQVDARKLLVECRRVLKPGGMIRLVVPDLQAMVIDYVGRKNGNGLSVSERITAADHLNERLGYRSPEPPRGSFAFRLYALWKDFHSHKWMYDADSLTHFLSQAGFENVMKMEFRRSRIAGIEEVEMEDRVLNGSGVCVEAQKPGQ